MLNSVYRIKWSLVQPSENIIEKGNGQTGIRDYLNFFQLLFLKISKPQDVWGILCDIPGTKFSSVDIQDRNLSAVEKSPHLLISSFSQLSWSVNFWSHNFFSRT